VNIGKGFLTARVSSLVPRMEHGHLPPDYSTGSYTIKTYQAHFKYQQDHRTRIPLCL